MILLIELMLRFSTDLTKTTIATSITAMSFMLNAIVLITFNIEIPRQTNSIIEFMAGLQLDGTPKIIWHTVPSNTNGAITMKAYVEQILEVEVKK